MKAHPIWCKTHTKNMALLYAIKGVPDGTNEEHHIWYHCSLFFYSVDFKFDALYTIQVSLHREPPEVGLVKKLTGSLYSGWNSTCQPYIESAAAFSYVIVHLTTSRGF